RTADAAAPGRVVLGVSSGHRGERRSRRMADRRVPRDPAGCLRSGEVAAAAGVNVQTLHYYERLGLLAQARRTAAGHRQYPARTVTLVRMIKNAQRLGFSLDEVARLIAAGADPDEIAAIAARKLTEIDAQIARLTAIRDALALAASVADHDREQLTQTKPHRLETL